MTRFIVLAAFVGVLSAAGCSHDCASCGWEFRMGRPATFSSPGLVQQMNGPLQVAPLGTTLPPIISGTTAGIGPVELRSLTPPPAVRSLTPPADTCTMEDVCNLLRSIQAQLNAKRLERLPMPKGEGQE